MQWGAGAVAAVVVAMVVVAVVVEEGAAAVVDNNRTVVVSLFFSVLSYFFIFFIVSFLNSHYCLCEFSPRNQEGGTRLKYSPPGHLASIANLKNLRGSDARAY